MMTAAGRIRMMVLSLSILIFGCQVSTRPVNYYTLNSRPPGMNTSAGRLETARLTVGIGPISLPAYLDRPQIVTRLSPNQLKIDDFHRWADPLQDDFLRVLMENLKALSKSWRVVPYPWSISHPPDLAVTVQVHAFEGLQSNRAILQATVTLRNLHATEKPSTSWDINLEKRADIADYDALTSAQSALLAELSRNITAVITSLKP